MGSKYKIKYVDEDLFCVLEYQEDGDEMIINRVKEGTIFECSDFIEKLIHERKTTA